MVEEVKAVMKKVSEKTNEIPNDLEPKKWREYEKEGLQFFSVWDTARAISNIIEV